MSGGAWEKFMVHVDIGTNLKLQQLPVAQRWVFVGGVLAIAAKSPIRGTLMIPPAEPVTPRHVARQAGVTPVAADNALTNLRDLRILVPSEDLDGFESVHDFEIYNPSPPASSREGERIRKAAQRARQKVESRAA